MDEILQLEKQLHLNMVRISNLKVMDKLKIYPTEISIEKWNYWQFFSRSINDFMYGGSNRHVTLKHIENVCEILDGKSKMYIEKLNDVYTKQNYRNFCILQNAQIHARNRLQQWTVMIPLVLLGLGNLQRTYDGDSEITTRICTCRKQLEKTNNDISSFLCTYYPKKSN